MKITPQEVAGCELIGKKISVKHSSNKSLIGLEGKVIDEKRNTLAIEAKNKKITLIKKQVSIEFAHKNQKFLVDGEILVGRPEDRLKLKLK